MARYRRAPQTNPREARSRLVALGQRIESSRYVLVLNRGQIRRAQTGGIDLNDRPRNAGFVVATPKVDARLDDDDIQVAQVDAERRKDIRVGHLMQLRHDNDALVLPKLSTATVRYRLTHAEMLSMTANSFPGKENEFESQIA